jgi:hypothetical protein
LLSWQRSYGSYYYLPTNPQENVSLLAEANYNMNHGWYLKGAFGMDGGKLRGNNYGIQITISKTGLIGK